MKKSILIAAIGIICCTKGIAATTTSTITVPGAAKSISTHPTSNGGSATVIDCTNGNVCYTETTTSTDFVRRVGDKIELSGTNASDGSTFEVVGGYVDHLESVSVESIAHTYLLTPTWNN